MLCSLSPSLHLHTHKHTPFFLAPTSGASRSRHHLTLRDLVAFAVQVRLCFALSLPLCICIRTSTHHFSWLPLLAHHDPDTISPCVIWWPLLCRYNLPLPTILDFNVATFADSHHNTHASSPPAQSVLPLLGRACRPHQSVLTTSGRA